MSKFVTCYLMGADGALASDASPETPPSRSAARLPTSDAEPRTSNPRQLESTVLRTIRTATVATTALLCAATGAALAGVHHTAGAEPGRLAGLELAAAATVAE